MISELSKLSAKIGKDLALIQGGGGNTSIKYDGKMWIKASGKWLADAQKENIFVSVDDNAIRQAIKQGDTDPVTPHIDKNQLLRPSIETTLHALLPHKIVLHTHSVNVISWVVRKDGEQQLQNKLQGLNWVWVNYNQPGILLTNAVNKTLKKNPDILILANHGVVVGADSCEEAEKLLYEIESRLSANQINTSAKADIKILTEISKNTLYIPASSEDVHTIATNSKKLKLASKGVFYPDHVVFLGSELCIMQISESIDMVVKNYKQQFDLSPVAIYVENTGVLVLKDISIGAEAMLIALAYVLMRLDLSAEYNYLDKKDVIELVNWEAEKYRKTIKQ